MQPLATAIHCVLDMPENDHAAWMQKPRTGVRENTICRRAARLLLDLTEIRIDAQERVEVR